MNLEGYLLNRNGLELIDVLCYSNSMISLSDIRDVARRIGNKANAESVILFGSHARGDAGRSSDVDLLVIAESNEPRFKRSRDLYKLFSPHPFGMDILV